MIASNLATNLFAFVLVLGFLIFAHEAGHFFMAKLFRVRVLVFSFGFGQRLFGFKRGDTDYRVSLIPLGGYVRMAGDTPEENQPSDPGEFLSKPKWQRFLILLAGPFMNLLIAVAFIAAIDMAGKELLIERPMIGEVSPGKPAAQAGLRVGDQIVSVNGEPFSDFADLRLLISTHADTPLKVEYIRNGIRHSTTMTPVKEETDYGPVGRVGVLAWIDPIVGAVEPKSPAARAGMRAGDRILYAGGQPISRLTQLGDILEHTQGKPLPLTIQRGSQRIAVILPPGKNPGFIPPTRIRKLSLIPALEDSVAENRKLFQYTFLTIGRLFRGQASVKEVSGPFTLARVSGEMLRQGWLAIISLTAMISLQLGIMNLLPIPVLDGGHIMVLAIEGAVRHDLSIRMKERIKQVGFAVLAALMIVVLYNDVITNVLLLRKG